MSNQLLPCPFCGAEPTPYTWKAVGCMTPNCAMEGLHIYHEAWNRRANQPAAGEPVATLMRKRSIGSPSVGVVRFDASRLPEGDLVDVYLAPPAAAPVAAGEPVALTADDLEGFKLGLAYDEEPGSDCWNNAITKVQCHLREIGTKLVAAPPAAVHGDDPEQWTDQQVRNFLATALRHVDVKGTLHCQDIRDGFKVMRAQAGEGGE